MSRKIPKNSVGLLRSFIDTKHQHFMFEETDHFRKYQPVFFYKDIKILNRRIRAYRLEEFKIDAGHAFFPQATIDLFSRYQKINHLRILHAQFILDVGEFFGLIGRTRLPIAANYRGFELSNKAVVSFLPLVFPRLAKMITKSQFQKDQLVKMGYHKNKIQVIYGGVNCDAVPFKIRPCDRSDIRILSAARFVEKKGFPTTLLFFQGLRRRNKNARLTLIGDGEKKEEIEQAVKKLRLSDAVQLVDFMNHDAFIKQLYCHDVFVLSSKTAKNGDIEGIPNVLKEAMASGMPVISTRHSGIPELVIEGETGYLAEEEDPAGMVDQCEKILRDQKRTRKICTQARRFIEDRFDAGKCAKKIEMLYDKILE